MTTQPRPEEGPMQFAHPLEVPADLANDLLDFADAERISVNEAAVRLIRAGLRAMADRAADGMD